MRRLFAAAGTAILLVAVAYAARTTTPGTDRNAPTQSQPSRNDPAEGQARGGNPEAAEQTEETQERLESLESARRAGTFGVDRTTLSATAAAGWAGERVFNPNVDDWEPAIGADPNAPYVYVLTTRYGVGKACPGNCPAPWIATATSTDGGATWGPQHPLCACKGSGQFDPIVEVVPNTGAVDAAYMNGYNVMFVRSIDHGATWSAPVKTYGNVSWNDKPTLATSDSGRDVYVSFNGPQGGDPWMAQSHDFGRTWTQKKLVRSSRYYYDFDSDVTHGGRILFAETSLDYGSSTSVVGTVKVHVFVSSDRGTTWKNVVVDSYPPGEPCADCRADFYVGHAAISADDDGTLTLAYDAPTTAYGPQRIYVRHSTDGGRTWIGRTALSAAGENASMPAMESTGSGDVRLFYFQTANGDDPDAWNVRYRSSTDGGRTWTSPIKISDRSGGASYKLAAGFGEPYGDYGEAAITSAGKFIGAWGEGPSYAGPGGVWINRQT